MTHLDFESSFEATGKETSEGTNHTAEEREGDRMKHEWVHCDGPLQAQLQLQIHSSVKCKFLVGKNRPTEEVG